MAETSTNGPAPSKHVFLSDLFSQENGDKVRFLCCILDIDENSAHLEVEHCYPQHATNIPKVIVNYDLQRGNQMKNVLQKGNWVNVIGYIRGKSLGQRQPMGISRLNGQLAVHVQAVLIWNAGAIHLAEYERTLEQQKTANLERED